MLDMQNSSKQLQLPQPRMHMPSQLTTTQYILAMVKTLAFVENFCSKLNRPANEILLRTARTSRDCRKLQTAWYQIFVSNQLSSSDAHIFTTAVLPQLTLRLYDKKMEMLTSKLSAPRRTSTTAERWNTFF